MFYQIYAITIKELKTLFRDRTVLAVLFFLPVVFVLVMTFAGVGNQGLQPAKIVVVNQDTGAVAQRIVDRLQLQKGLIVQDTVNGKPLNESSAKNLLMKRNSNIALILVFPPNFSQTLLSTSQMGSNVLVKFIADPATGGENLDPIERLIEIQVMNVAGALGAARESQNILTNIISTEPNNQQTMLQSLSKKFSLSMNDIDAKVQNLVEFKRVLPVGWVTSRPITAEEQNVPGYTIFGVFFIVQVIGNTFLREKESGTLTRLMAAPISRSVFLIGKLIPFYIVNLVQVIFMFLFGYLVFHISLGDSPLGLLVISIATAAVANALGLFIAAISKTTEQMGPLSGLILICMATLGGIFVPSFEMPKLMQELSFITPHAWALKGFQDILVRGYDLVAVLPTAGVLLIFAFIFYTLALLRFRFK